MLTQVEHTWGPWRRTLGEFGPDLELGVTIPVRWSEQEGVDFSVDDIQVRRPEINIVDTLKSSFEELVYGYSRAARKSPMSRALRSASSRSVSGRLSFHHVEGTQEKIGRAHLSGLEEQGHRRRRPVLAARDDEPPHAVTVEPGGELRTEGLAETRRLGAAERRLVR